MAKSAAAKATVIQAIAAEVREFCIEHANPELVRKYAKFFTEGYDAYGIDHKDPEWTRMKAEWAQRLREAGPTAYLDAGDVLTHMGKYEECSIAIVCAAEMRDRFNRAAFTRIGKWFEGGIRNWGHTDVICSMVLSPFLLDGVVDLGALAAWRTSEYKYQRRAVPVAMIPLLDVRTEYAPMLSMIEPLMSDAERVVHQGTGWFLREAWKRQAPITDEFLFRYKDTAPRLIYQYATEKMTTDQKQRFRRAR